LKETKENILDNNKAVAVGIVEGEANCKGRLATESLSKKMAHHDA